MNARPIYPCALVIAWLLSGCYHPAGGSRSYGSHAHRGEVLQNPVVAVTDFENRSGFSGQWELGSGMADVLTTHLIDSQRFTVLERKHIQNVVGELRRQGGDLFRKEGRVFPGRLKNARYLIRGVVTDFTVTGDVSGWFDNGTSKGRARSSRARVAINLMVSDVESGEILSSVQTSGSSTAWGLGGGTSYKGMRFGGDAFFRSPLGRATDSAMQRAIHQLLRDIPMQRWEPRIAEVQGFEVVINGGKNVGVREGVRYAILGPARTITDPTTGDVIESIPGQPIGRVRVNQVLDKSSHASLIEGKAKRGDLLRPE